MNEPVISLQSVGKKYQLDHQEQFLIGKFFHSSYKEEFWALKDINLDIMKGEKIGIFGPNGSGKSTLLRIISGITAPSLGKVQVKGRVLSMANLEAGFHPELTGEENIYLNSAILGLSLKEVRQRYKSIVDFSGIGRFIDVPFYMYSDGMKFRLAFSLVVNGDFDILIMDEVFVSGDIDFQNKTLSTINNLQKSKGLTTLVCSHIPRLILSVADKFYKLEKGEICKGSRNDILKAIRRRDRFWSDRIIKHHT